EVLYNKATGFMHMNHMQAVLSNTETTYRIGSVTKMFTATMILQLVDEGKLSLDTKLAEYYPKIANADKITIRQMLNHTSGIHSFTDDSVYLEYYTTPQTQEQLLDRFYKLTPDFEPGKETGYSNTAYVLLGYIIEKITGNTYAEELKKRITKVADLENTYYGETTKARRNNEAHSFNYDGKDWKEAPETDMSVPHGAGAIISTPNDMVKFITALFTGKLLKPETLELMKTCDKSGFGLGCMSFGFQDKVAYGHGGSIDAFESNLAFFPGDSLAVAVCSNGLNYSMNQLMIDLLSIVYKNDFQLPIFTEFILNAETLEAYKGVYAAPGFPLKITVTPQGNQLSAQATGQPSFILEAQSETLFKFDPAAITIEFVKDENGTINTFKFTQGGFKTVFVKE
ncbi:MAG TPA: serine hydrolase domain-containing protein, partial [Bacteroidia bacterium]|nr:serine hydrolase domain-containing protein [Bacteroidia bacterium]